MAGKITFVVGIILVIAVAVFLFFFLGYGGGLVQFSSPFNVSVEVGNSPPVIDSVDFVNVGAILGGMQEISVNFSASDSNTFSDLNDLTARVEIYNVSKGVNPGMRVNSTCSATASSGNTKNYTCTIGMWYFDPAGYYIVNATVSDNGGLTAENSSSLFNYLETKGEAISPDMLNWDPISVSDVNKLSKDNLTINNTGNANLNNIAVTAYDLPGSSSGFIYAGNFSVSVSYGCSGDTMSNSTPQTITTAVLPVGNLSIVDAGQEKLYFCITAINSNTPATTFSSSYTSLGGVSWVIDFI